MQLPFFFFSLNRCIGSKAKFMPLKLFLLGIKKKHCIIIYHYRQFIFLIYINTFFFKKVLDSGRLKEFDEPHLLLQNRCSYFYQLVEQTGSITELAQAARQAYLHRHQPQTYHSVPDSVKSYLSSYIPTSGFTDLQLISNV